MVEREALRDSEELRSRVLGEILDQITGLRKAVARLEAPAAFRVSGATVVADPALLAGVPTVFTSGAGIAPSTPSGPIIINPATPAVGPTVIRPTE